MVGGGEEKVKLINWSQGSDVWALEVARSAQSWLLVAGGG